MIWLVFIFNRFRISKGADKLQIFAINLMKIFWYPIHEERTTSADVIEDTIDNFSLKFGSWFGLFAIAW